MPLRLAGAALAVLVLVLAGCGAKQQHHQQTTTRKTAGAGSFDVRVVGPLHVALPGVRATPGG